MRTGAALVLLALLLSACGNKAKEAKPGQALASVNGSEVTVLQLNEELQRAGVPASQQDAASKQLLQALIDRQLLVREAEKEKLDRDPKVMQAVDRARDLIVAQAYIQKRLGGMQRPGAAEVEEYFNKHPEFFTNRKQFNMNELVIAASDMTPDLKAAADGARSLEEVAVWLDTHKVKHGRTQVTRSTADLNPELSQKLLAMPKGQIFIVKEGERAMLISIAEVKDAPVSLEVAAPQIEQFLVNQKSKELAAAEVKRLRQGAKIDYINKSLAPDAAAAATPATASPAAVAPAAAASDDADKAALERGVAGLK
ncbi:peptidyl-prolyl cis-trans isomerase, EpsD family [Massilia horti]|uniref:peptidylprolyl isomerase n=2 Tax=Massilia horti TaxID=2562153 RepID=A0A4Y9T5Q1_9BURK|nr:peptidyl-prolyl cis-trans isomerase, EpsD family [Massilia horti]